MLTTCVTNRRICLVKLYSCCPAHHHDQRPTKRTLREDTRLLMPPRKFRRWDVERIKQPEADVVGMLRGEVNGEKSKHSHPAEEGQDMLS